MRKAHNGLERYWRRIMAFAPATFTVRDVCGSRSEFREASRYMRRLEKGGYVRLAGRDGGANLWALERPSREAPRLGDDGKPVLMGQGYAHMWNAMRMLKGWWRTDELAGVASTSEVPVPASTAIYYVKHLRLAGYLDSKRDSATRRAMFKLRPTHNTGPKAPQILRSPRRVFDPNRGRILDAREAADARD